jgi:hypothetical protein
MVTRPDRYPLPSLADFANKLHGRRYFSVVDLVKGYHQIPMVANDIAKTAILTPFGLYEYVYMPLGLRNAAQTCSWITFFGTCPSASATWTTT